MGHAAPGAGLGGTWLGRGPWFADLCPVGCSPGAPPDIPSLSLGGAACFPQESPAGALCSKQRGVFALLPRHTPSVPSSCSGISPSSPFAPPHRCRGRSCPSHRVWDGTFPASCPMFMVPCPTWSLYLSPLPHSSYSCGSFSLLK